MRWLPLAMCALAAAPGCGACGDGLPWDGRYEGAFEGTYAGATPTEAGLPAVVRSTFSGGAVVEIGRRQDGTLAIHVTDCDTTWTVDDQRATLVTAPAPEGCLLDVAGHVGVIELRPRNGDAHLEGDALRLGYDAEAVSPRSGTGTPQLSFRFTGERTR